MRQRRALDVGGARTADEAITRDAVSAALQARIQWGYLRAEINAIFRTVPAMLAAVTEAPPRGSTLNPERFVSLTVDYHFRRPRITLAGSFGVRHPGAVRMHDAAGPLVLVIGRDGPSAVLRDGREPSLVYSARIRARVDISEMLYALVFVQYVRDPNDSEIVSFGNGMARVGPDTHHIGLGVSAAARF